MSSGILGGDLGAANMPLGRQKSKDDGGGHHPKKLVKQQRSVSLDQGLNLTDDGKFAADQAIFTMSGSKMKSSKRKTSIAGKTKGKHLHKSMSTLMPVSNSKKVKGMKRSATCQPGLSEYEQNYQREKLSVNQLDNLNKNPVVMVSDFDDGAKLKSSPEVVADTNFLSSSLDSATTSGMKSPSTGTKIKKKPRKNSNRSSLPLEILRTDEAAEKRSKYKKAKERVSFCESTSLTNTSLVNSGPTKGSFEEADQTSRAGSQDSECRSDAGSACGSSSSGRRATRKIFTLRDISSSLSTEEVFLAPNSGTSDSLELMKQGEANSRNAKTAPSTPEAECRAPPRHAESTSQLEISTGLGKRTNGLTSIKGLETSLEKADQLHQPPQPSGKALHPHKELSPKMNKSRNDKFHKIFKTVPEKEIVLKSYLCAYVGDILLQGYLYVSPNYFCFYTKILGHEKQLEIPVTEVVNITREKTAFIIPNAIGVLTSRDKYVFGSLMSRDSTYRLMVNVWKKTNPGPAVYNQTVTDSDLSADDDKDYFDASDADGHKLSDDLHNADSLSDASDDDDTSICSECGTPMAEHTPGNTCDNSPNTQTTIPEATAQEGFDQVDGPRRAPAVMSSPSPATGATGRKLSRSHRSVTEDGGRGHCLSSGEPAQTKWYSLSCSGLKNKYDWLNKKTSWAAGLPHTNLLLLTCLVIAVFLILSAGIMAYKILTLQAEIDHSLQWLDPTHARHARSQKLHSDLYGLNHKLHETTIERFHGVLEANIELLNEVHSSLHSLQNSPILKAAMDCPPPPIVSDDNS